MPILKNVLGLDLGSCALKAVEVEQSLRSVEAVRLHGVLRDESRPLADQVDGLLDTHAFQREYVVTAVRGDRVSVRRLHFPFSEKRRVAQAVPFELEDQVPFEIEDMVLDWEVLTRERNRSEVISVLTPRSEVSELISVLHQAQCDPRVIEADGLVLANLTTVFDLPGNRLLVDIGHSKTTFCAMQDGRAISARSIGIAGRAFTEAIGKERALNPDEAQRSKHEQGAFSAGTQEPLPAAAEVLDRLANEILRFGNSLEPMIAGGIDGVTLLGGGSLLRHIDAWLNERTGIPVERIGLPKEDAGIKFAASDGEPAVFAPAIALALRGTTRAASHINLRQDEFARRTDFSWVRREFGSTGILAAGVVALALLNFGVGAVLESREAGGVEAHITRLYSEAFPERAVPENPIAAMRDAVRDANERAEFLGVYRGNLSALDVLTEISRRIPADLDVGFEELSVDKQTVRIRVHATTFEAADRLGAELSKFGPFDQARIGAIETDKRNDSKKFNVTISLATGDPS